MKTISIFLITMGFVGCSHLQKTDRDTEAEKDPNYALLADEVLKGLPRNSTKWCLYMPLRHNRLPKFREALLEGLRERFVAVYQSDSEILDVQKILRNGELVGYRGGFRFDANPEVLAVGKIRIGYFSWSGDLNSASYFEVYEWNGNSWDLVEVSQKIVSDLQDSVSVLTPLESSAI